MLEFAKLIPLLAVYGPWVVLGGVVLGIAKYGLPWFETWLNHRRDMRALDAGYEELKSAHNFHAKKQQQPTRPATTLPAKPKTAQKPRPK
jgi:uncharacterized membrane protein YbhN (UPF0104 family)